MEISTFHDLLNPLGQRVISAAMTLNPREADFLLNFQTLCKAFSPELARASLETAILQNEGQIKFPNSTQMYFTRQALQQASSYPISRCRAHRYKGFYTILDLGCSIGGDTLSLAQIGPKSELTMILCAWGWQRRISGIQYFQST